MTDRCPHAEDAFPECEPCHIRRLEAEVTDGIATGLSRALVALEGRKQELGKVSSRDAHDRGRAHEAAMSAKLVRGLLEALVDGPTDPGGKLAQR